MTRGTSDRTLVRKSRLSRQHAERNIQWLDAMSRKYHAHLPEEEHLRRARNQKEDEAYFAWLVSEVSARTAHPAVDRYRVYCVSAAPDNTLMWSHYAASHTGSVLSSLVGTKFLGLPSGSNTLAGIPPSIYLTTRTTPSCCRGSPSQTRGVTEQEFRVIAQEVATPPPPDEVLVTRNGLLKLPPGASKSVILGCSISPAAAAHNPEPRPAGKSFRLSL